MAYNIRLFWQKKHLDLPSFPQTVEEMKEVGVLFLPVHPAFVPYIRVMSVLLDHPDNFTEDSDLSALQEQIFQPLLRFEDICQEQHGADFRLDQMASRSLEELQGIGVGLPDPWEFQITDEGQLEYKTKEET